MLCLMNSKFKGNVMSCSMFRLAPEFIEHGPITEVQISVDWLNHIHMFLALH